ncbi:hypothetical protein L596_015372 [Steinernema carpocapsae]|uniref:BUB1 N-terminal domain-containing protein n=1 Tax=Steinernema carpocapsae TaxID=34508 RepID=A0A4U5NFN8_STECR|nr:hypothetical protein L596_015372 [Steinernema carpocapsae]
MTEEGDFEWELNRENIRPLRSGRHAASLQHIGSRPTVSAREAQERFQELFDKDDEEEDPLKPFYDYVCWFEETFHSGRQNIFYPILWKIVRRFATTERYRNEQRMLKLWFKLADNCPERCFPIIAYAFDKHCCTKMAQFYVRWAQLFECIEDFQSAREKLKLGKNHLAEPTKELDDASDQLEVLILRESLKRQNDVSDDEDVEECREVLGQLQAVDRERAPIIRQAHSSAGKITGLEPNQVIGRSNRGPDSFSIFTSDMQNDEDFMLLFGPLQAEQGIGMFGEEDNHGEISKFTVNETPSAPKIPTAKPAFQIFCDDPEVQQRTQQFYDQVDEAPKDRPVAPSLRPRGEQPSIQKKLLIDSSGFVPLQEVS